MWEFETPRAAHTRACAARLARELTPGCVVALSGELGAGKTEFVRGLARGLGVAQHAVRSPTFTLINRYPARGCTLVHVDVYRLGGPAALIDLGYEEVFDPEAVVAIEWASKVREVLPPEHLAIALAHRGDDRRLVRVQAYGARYEALVRRWREAVAAMAQEAKRCD